MADRVTGFATAVRAALALVAGGICAAGAASAQVKLPGRLLHGGALLHSLEPGRATAIVGPGAVRDATTTLAAGALRHCFSDTLDARTVMREAEADVRPTFVNPNASKDYAPDIVEAEGAAVVLIETRDRKEEDGSVHFFLSDGVKAVGPDRARFRHCSVWQSSGDNAALSTLLARPEAGAPGFTTTADAGSYEERRRIWWMKLVDGRLVPMKPTGSAGGLIDAMAAIRPGEKLMVLDETDRGHLQMLGTSLYIKEGR